MSKGDHPITRNRIIGIISLTVLIAVAAWWFLKRNDSIIEAPINGQEKQKEPSPQSPIAANFDINPMLESHIGNTIHGGDYEFEIIKPQSGTRLKIKKGEVIFRFSGLLKTDKTTLNDDFQVHLFSNKKEDYEIFRPVLTLPLSFDKIENDFKFDVVHHQQLRKGLYYYLLEDANSGEMIRVGKVKI